MTKVLGDQEVEQSHKTAVWQKPYLDVPLNKPDGGTTPDGVQYTYSANDASIGDLDGDGEYNCAQMGPVNSKIMHTTAIPEKSSSMHISLMGHSCGGFISGKTSARAPIIRN